MMWKTERLNNKLLFWLGKFLGGIYKVSLSLLDASGKRDELKKELFSFSAEFR